MVKSEDGKVVMVYYQPIPKLVRAGGHEIYFEPKFGISLALVNENMVNSLLAYRGGCCGGQRQVMFLANESQYKHWQDGHGGR